MKHLKNIHIIPVENVKKAASFIQEVALVTPLSKNQTTSQRFGGNIFLKREDLQVVRSYKIRGAYNKMRSLGESERKKGVVCASAGNHAQGVALSCKKLKVHGTIYMPVPTPKQKIEQVKMFGDGYVTIKLTGDTFDDSFREAMTESLGNNQVFIHPFDDISVMEGQATVGLEILEQSQQPIDYLFLPVGGGGLAAGVASIFKTLSPATKIIGVEPKGAPSMSQALENDEVIRLDTIDKFVDGAAVQRVGEKTFELCKVLLDDVITVHEGKVCQVILELYNKDAIVVEPAGALALAALDQYEKQLKGKNVVCVVSGSNNDITRTAEIKERALLYANLKHYFIVRFPQRAGALKQFVGEVLGPDDDITHFQYSKKHARENGPAVVGVELKRESDLEPLIERMKARNFYGDYLNNKPDLFQFLV